jgi:hypothetical protein
MSGTGRLGQFMSRMKKDKDPKGDVAHDASGDHAPAGTAAAAAVPAAVPAVSHSSSFRGELPSPDEGSTLTDKLKAKLKKKFNKKDEDGRGAEPVPIDPSMRPRTSLGEGGVVVTVSRGKSWCRMGGEVGGGRGGGEGRGGEGGMNVPP